MEIFDRRMPSGGTIHIEEIQDQVELQLMRNEEYTLQESTFSIVRKELKKEVKMLQKLQLNKPRPPNHQSNQKRWYSRSA